MRKIPLILLFLVIAAGFPLPASDGVVIYSGFNGIGSVFGAKGFFYYYTHLQRIETRVLWRVNRGDIIGTVGNAQGKTPHWRFV
ncbi:MAG: M23 family metallopeptidase [Methylobacter sp.]|nr:M23 family metallopeptidase [Methylobacter sp.]